MVADGRARVEGCGSTMETVVIIDAGASSWCCGYHESEGPDVTMPGVGFTDRAAWGSQLAAAFEQLEVNPSEVSVLLSEPPGVSAADREHAAKTLFHEHSVLALHMAASPLQALYHYDKTALVVDCAGGEGASVYAVYDGFALLEGAAIAPLTDLADAILRTVALVDTSLRGALLARVLLVGAASMEGGLAEELQQELKAALASSPWEPRVLAKSERAFICWLGGATFCAMSSAEAAFVTRAEYDLDPAELGRRCPSVSGLPIHELEARHKAAAQAAAKARARARGLAARRIAAEAEEGRRWWVSQAPAGGAEERVRMRWAQANVVRPLYRGALTRLGLESGEASGGGGIGGGAAGGGGASLRQARLSSSSDEAVGEEAATPRRAASPKGPWSPAALAAVWGRCLEQLRAPGGVRGVANQGRLSSGNNAASEEGNSEDGVWRQVAHALAAAWASSPMNVLLTEEAEATCPSMGSRDWDGSLAVHWRAASRRSAWRCWRRWRLSRLALEQRAAAHFAARRAWVLLWRGLDAWKTCVGALLDAARVLHRIELCFALRRGFAGWMRWMLSQRWRWVLLAVGQRRRLQGTLVRGVRSWARRLPELARGATLSAEADGCARGLALGRFFRGLSWCAEEETRRWQQLASAADGRFRAASLASYCRRLRTATAARHEDSECATQLRMHIRTLLLARPARAMTRWAATARYVRAVRIVEARLSQLVYSWQRARALRLWAQHRARRKELTRAMRRGDDLRRIEAFGKLAAWALTLRAVQLADARLSRAHRRWRRAAALKRWRQHAAHRQTIARALELNERRQCIKALWRLAAWARFAQAVEAWGRTVPSLSDEIASTNKAALGRLTANPLSAARGLQSVELKPHF